MQQSGGNMNLNREKSFGYRFGVLNRMYLNHFKDDMNQLGISPTQAPLVSELLNAGSPVTQEELSKRLFIDKGTVARALDHLEKNGIVIRKVNPDNRRQNHVSPSEKCYEISDEFFRILRSPTEKFLKGFSEKEKKNTLKLLNRMILNAKNERI